MIMKTVINLWVNLILSFAFVSACILKCSAAGDRFGDFRQCLIRTNNSLASGVYAPTNSSFSSVLQFPIGNMRFNDTSMPKPGIIVTPSGAAEIQAVVVCARKVNLHLRVRSGGHDYEGLSYTSGFYDTPFVLVDVSRMRKVSVDVEKKTAWVESGTTLGELYYHVGNASRNLGFPGGVCPTVGTGGHISGGGYGAMMRKYGLAADHVIDAVLVNANGTILDRELMGEDLFWAIRGGGGNTFGIIVSWKVRLVYVPNNVTVLKVNRDLGQNATKLVHKWQYIAPRMPPELFLRLSFLQKTIGNDSRNRTVVAHFVSTFLGGVESLISIMDKNFPELGVKKEDCKEMRWVESVLDFYDLPTETPKLLLNRVHNETTSYKAKADYVQKPIPEEGLKGLWELLLEDEAQNLSMDLNPYGGRMDEISESALPFPHRAGNLYNIQYLVYWSGSNHSRYIEWSRRVEAFLTPYVSNSPRVAYVNCRDLDVGMNTNGRNTSYEEAVVWGEKCFKNNFEKLVQVKTKVDPTNFFRNEQSVPPLKN
ncbi:unnamed protein product [Cuscuta epithymum]|uniref:FAD-binding PCMH-type domain-containing protein n=1 Tax=Cuscuta epithymum TaxID=186058 RepID=A0AAV0CXV4_9ASTE|nr:unnamed protein product [Cuscuta epithymum]